MFVTLILVLVVCLCWLSEATEDSRAFQQWKQRYHKTYPTYREELQALANFRHNAQILRAAFSFPEVFASSTWQGELNQFADLTNEDFQQRFLLPRLSVDDLQAQFSNYPRLNMTILRQQQQLKRPSNAQKLTSGSPDQFDWRTDGPVATVTRVRDQGSVGSCWAFSTSQNIEGQWALAGHSLVELSAEYFVDCDGTYDDKHADCSVFGGWPYLAYQFAIKSKGVPSEADLPYCAGTGDCYPCMLGPVKLCGAPPLYCDPDVTARCGTIAPTATISTWTSISQNEEEIKDILYSQGPLSVLLDASQLQYYKSGIWDGEIPGTNPKLGCSSTSLNHAVLLVGYGVENNTPYWVVKNSWGERWGENGYFRITRGAGKCGINTGVTTSLV